MAFGRFLDCCCACDCAGRSWARFEAYKGLELFTPGYISQVWNLPALSGVLIGGIPLEELRFGFSFSWYWTGVYEHFTWRMSATLVVTAQ